MTDHACVATPKMILSCRDQSNHVQSMTKTRWNNEVTDRTGLVYTKFEIEL